MGALCLGSCFVMQPASMPNQNYCKTRKDTNIGKMTAGGGRATRSHFPYIFIFLGVDVYPNTS